MKADVIFEYLMSIQQWWRGYEERRVEGEKKEREKLKKKKLSVFEGFISIFLKFS